MRTETVFFIILFLELVFQRIFELGLAQKHTRELLRLGAVEYGSEHYWMFIVLHSCFLICLCLEAAVFGVHPPADQWGLFTVFVLAQLMRVWIIRSLGVRWTTRIIVQRNQPLVVKGPFRWFTHPNYMVVAIEIFVFPWMFGLQRTAILFSILNALVLLFVRIPKENRALLLSRG